MSLEDLQSFKVREGAALEVPMGDYTMYIPPPPAGGAILSFILNIMRGRPPQRFTHHLISMDVLSILTMGQHAQFLTA